MRNKENAPIGVFDSGLGGLTVVKQIIKLLPREDIVYFGDTARVPYGTKSKQAIIRFSIENSQILLQHKVKLIVVACNSSSSYAIPAIKKLSDIPVLGVIEAGAQEAVLKSVSGKIGVIATHATVESQQYVRAIARLNKYAKVYQQACPLFVPLVEEGWNKGTVTDEIIAIYLKPLLKKKVDTLILGCTHYPLLKNAIQHYCGSSVQMIDSSLVMAKQVQALLEKTKLCSPRKHQGKHKFMVSDRSQSFEKEAKSFLGFSIKSSKR